MAARFDTLAAAEALEDAGIDRAHAKAIATQLRVSSEAGEPVTRSELEAALAKLKTDLLERIAEIENRIGDIGNRLTWRLVGFMIAVNALLVAAVKLIP